MSFGTNYIKNIRNVGQQRTKAHHTLSFFTRPFLSKRAKLGGMFFANKCVYGGLGVYYGFAVCGLWFAVCDLWFAICVLRSKKHVSRNISLIFPQLLLYISHVLSNILPRNSHIFLNVFPVCLNILLRISHAFAIILQRIFHIFNYFTKISSMIFQSFY